MIQEQKTPLELAVQKQLLNQQLPAFSNSLMDKIISRISYEQQLAKLLPKLWTGALFAISSFALLIFSFVVSWHAFGSTGISKYLSLMFSDFSTITANWQDYAFSILESLPIGATILTLGTILASVFLINYGFNQYSSFRKIINTEAHAGK